jgi:hypothetical protein
LVPAMLILIAANVARPDAVEAVAPELMTPDDGASVRLVPLVVTWLPNWSCTATVTAGAIATATATSEGPCTKASLFAAAGVTLNADEAGEVVSPVAEAVAVRPFAAVSISMPPKVAVPPLVVAVLPALIVPDEGVRVTVRPESTSTTLPNWSCTCAVTAGDMAAPAVTLDGCWPNTTLFGVAAVILNELDGPAVVSPDDVAVRVRPVPAVLIFTALNVASPDVDDVVAPEAMVPDDGTKVTLVPLVVTWFPNWSCTATVTAGVIDPPAVVSEGPCPKTSLFAAAGATLNDVEAPDGFKPDADAVSASPFAAALILMVLKVAMPEVFVVAVFPELMTPAAGVSVTRTPLLDTALPKASCTCTVTAGDIDAPATTFEGPCAKASLFAAAAVTLNDDEAGVVVKPDAAALIVRPLNVAVPALVFAALPPLITPEEGVKVIVRPESVSTTLPKESCTCTVTAGVIEIPAVTVEGPWRNASLLAAAAVTLNDDDADETTEPTEAVMVRPVAAVLILIALKVARPDALVDAVLPDAIVPDDGVSVTVVPETGLPNASFAWTVTAGAIDAPATTLDGCCVNERLFTAAAVTSNADEAAELVKPEDAAVSVRPVAAVLIRMALNVARPDALVEADAPDAIVPAEGVSVTLALATDTLLPN